MKVLILTPAYGRDYRNQKEVVEAFKDNRDFVIHDISSPYDGRYANREDLINTEYTHVNIRYAKLRKVLQVRIR